jgi:predicted Kef-type K+ transport protein
MLVGVLVSRTEQSKAILKKMGDLGEAFFIPVFFASLGLAVSLGAVAGNVVLILILLAAITAIRFIAYTVPMVLLNFSFVEAVKVGSGLISMSEYGPPHALGGPRRGRPREPALFGARRRVPGGKRRGTARYGAVV